MAPYLSLLPVRRQKPTLPPSPNPGPRLHASTSHSPLRAADPNAGHAAAAVFARSPFRSSSKVSKGKSRQFDVGAGAGDETVFDFGAAGAWGSELGDEDDLLNETGSFLADQSVGGWNYGSPVKYAAFDIEDSVREKLVPVKGLEDEPSSDEEGGEVEAEQEEETPESGSHALSRHQLPSQTCQHVKAPSPEPTPLRPGPTLPEPASHSPASFSAPTHQLASPTPLREPTPTLPPSASPVHLGLSHSVEEPKIELACADPAAVTRVAEKPVAGVHAEADALVPPVHDDPAPGPDVRPTAPTPVPALDTAASARMLLGRRKSAAPPHLLPARPPAHKRHSLALARLIPPPPQPPPQPLMQAAKPAAPKLTTQAVLSQSTKAAGVKRPAPAAEAGSGGVWRKRTSTVAARSVGVSPVREEVGVIGELSPAIQAMAIPTPASTLTPPTPAEANPPPPSHRPPAEAPAPPTPAGPTPVPAITFASPSLSAILPAVPATPSAGSSLASTPRVPPTPANCMFDGDVSLVFGGELRWDLVGAGAGGMMTSTPVGFRTMGRAGAGEKGKREIISYVFEEEVEEEEAEGRGQGLLAEEKGAETDDVFGLEPEPSTVQLARRTPELEPIAESENGEDQPAEPAEPAAATTAVDPPTAVVVVAEPAPALARRAPRAFPADPPAEPEAAPQQPLPAAAPVAVAGLPVLTTAPSALAHAPAVRLRVSGERVEPKGRRGGSSARVEMGRGPVPPLRPSIEQQTSDRRKRQPLSHPSSQPAGHPATQPPSQQANPSISQPAMAAAHPAAHATPAPAAPPPPPNPALSVIRLTAPVPSDLIAHAAPITASRAAAAAAKPGKGKAGVAGGVALTLPREYGFGGRSEEERRERRAEREREREMKEKKGDHSHKRRGPSAWGAGPTQAAKVSYQP